MSPLNRGALLILSLAVTSAWANNTPQTLPFSQDWSNPGLITVADDWSGVPGIIGYRGDGLVTSTGTDPQLIGVDGTSTPVNVQANLAAPSATGGLAEFAIANPVVAMQGSGTADAPFLLLHLDTRGFTNIRVAYLLRDVDGSADNSTQPMALQFRVGSTGTFTNVAGGFVADASTGPSLAVQTNAVSQVLPASADNQPLVQVRIITADAVGADEWIGVDDLSVTGTVALSGIGTATPATVAAGAASMLTVAVTPGSPPTSTGITVSVDLSSIGGSATQAFVDDGTGDDLVAGDNIFTFDALVTAGTTAGLKTLPVTIADAQARSASTSISLTVQVPSSPSGVVTVSPAAVDLGGQTLLTVAVTPGTVPDSTGILVVADLTALGGALEQLLDDGLNGDLTAGDNVYSFRVSIPLATTPGVKTVDLVVADAQGRSATPSTTLTVRTPTNPSVVAIATPASVVIGAQALLTATVTPGTNPTSTGVVVTVDLTSIGGSATQGLVDDGSNGDVTAGDLIFSFLAPVAPATPVGNKTLPVSVADALSRTASASIALAVTFGPAPTGNGGANPNMLLAGAGTLLTVTVTPGTTPASTGLTVVADLTGIGGSATASLFDDGTGGDVTAADLVFSLQTTVSAGTSPGGKVLAVTITDAQARTGTAAIPLSVLGPTNPSGNGLATPATVQAGSPSLLTVAVTPGTNPTSTGLAVSADLSTLGGSATQAFVDDGTGGDAAAADGVFSFNVTVPVATAPGVFTLPASITDGQARTGTTNISLTVSAAPTNPVAVAAASPSMLPAGAATLLTVAVTPGANPTSTALAVSADLSAIGGSTTQAFLDDGALGDVAAGDDIFTFRAIVAGATAVGAKSMPVSVVDGQARTASATLALTVSAASTAPVATGTATPAAVAAGGVSMLEVTITPGANPASTGLTATVDLRPVGGVAAQALLDDGANGDVAAGDGVFSFRVTVASGTAAGLKSLPVSVVDAQARTAAATVSLTVNPPASNPSAVGAANPGTVMPGSNTLLTVTVTPGAMPTSTGLVVTANLTSIGGSATQAFFDDGTMGDATAGDLVFSFDALVPGSASAGTRSMTATVTDAQARMAGAAITLIVSAPPAMCGNSIVEGGEQCDDGNTAAGDCCSMTCLFEAAATVCRAAAGACDLEEKCTGTSARCPGDVKGSGVCRPAAGVCDVAERCDGLAAECPVDAFSTQVCRAAAQSCDLAEQCDGSSAECPANATAADETSCGEANVCRAGACVVKPVTEPPKGCGCTSGNAGGLLALALLALVRRSRKP